MSTRIFSLGLIRGIENSGLFTCMRRIGGCSAHSSHLVWHVRQNNVRSAEKYRDIKGAVSRDVLSFCVDCARIIKAQLLINKINFKRQKRQKLAL